jgi:fumarylacetoacetase
MARSDALLDHSHDPEAKSWIATANEAGNPFPVQNLPFGVYRKIGSADAFRACSAIGNSVIDLAAVDADYGPNLNGLAGEGHATWRSLRHKIFALLTDESKQSKTSRYLHDQSEVELGLPIQCPNFTDFYTSYFHAFNAGSIFRPDAPMTPNFKWLPIAYHGRASSVMVSGSEIRRPRGQRIVPGDSSPTYGPSLWLDYEVELGLVMGPGNRMGETISVDDAESHIFGVVLLNDWSARDIQAFEYDPLGPFLAKSFATTISPWIVTMDALAPFRSPAFTRFAGDPDCPPHLDSSRNQANGHLDIQLEAYLNEPDSAKRTRLSRTSYNTSYWTPAQLVAHHTSAGCPLVPGDILGTGTISGPTPEEAGTMLELSQAAQNPIILASGNTRTFLEDGDSVSLSGACSRPGFASIGFGEASGRILPAQTS